MAELEACRLTDEAVVVGLYPDVCLTPPSNAPVPYMIVARFSDSIRWRPTVRFRGVEAMTDFGRLSRVYGDEAGVGGGVVSGVNMGSCRPQTYSSSVFINGQAVVRHDDFVDMNCASPDGPGNTVGKVMYVPVGAPLPIGPMGEVAGDTNPPVEPETEEETSFLGHVGGFFKGAWDGTTDLVGGVYTIGKTSVQMGALGYVFDRDGFYDKWGTVGDMGAAVVDDPGVLLDVPGALWDGFTQPYVERWSQGRYGEAIGYAVPDVLGVIFGTKGADKAARGATLGSRAATLADDAARAGTRSVDDVARAAADDVGRLGDDAAGIAAREADDAARAGTDGLQVLGSPVQIPRGVLDDIVDEANRVASAGGEITDAQRRTLRQNLPEIQRRSAAQNQVVRREFVRDQGRLMRQWEEATGRSWPVDGGRRATPHHIVPLESGGANKWWNLMPTHGALPNHSLPGVAGPHASGSVLRSTIQQGRSALPPGTVTDIRRPF